MHQIDNDVTSFSVRKQAVADKMINSKVFSIHNISEKELEVLKYMSEGLSSKQIADKLNKSIHTINNQRKNMMQKTKANNLFQLLTYAIRNNFI